MNNLRPNEPPVRCKWATISFCREPLFRSQWATCFIIEWYAVIRDYDTTDFYGNVSHHHEIFTKANGWQSGNEYFADEDSWYHFLPGDEIQFTEAWAEQTLPATFTFCAQWLPNILVQYDLNGGSGTTPASKTGTYLDGYPISETQGF